jgi:misacylated tRNA(Ala) deacylase
MTELLYHVDSYVQAFEARVVSDDDIGVMLDRTAFYPGGGGQPADTGVLDTPGGFRSVVALRRVGNDLVHVLAEGTPLPAGTLVRGQIDWDRRYRLMQTHTAMHLLCGVIWRDHGVLVTGGNMEPGRGRLDFDFPGLDWSTAHVIQERINDEVRAARPVRVAFHSRDEAAQIPNLVRTKTNLVPSDIARVRTIEIVGLDLQADGGTHVANTRELGPVRIVGLKNKGRANKRLELALADVSELGDGASAEVA